MSAVHTLPPIPRPPDDPTWWLLNARAGWRPASLQNVEQAPDCETLTLTLRPGSGRSLVEDSGSFGGVTLPANVALGPDDDLYLLDQTSGLLKRFDPCACAFETIPCIGGIGPDPRQVQDPWGIGISRGNLFVCDAGNRRLDVFSLRGFALRAVWSPPATAVPAPWKPYAVAFDGRGRVYVSDPDNGCVHRFSSAGTWQTAITGLGSVRNIALDCDDRLYVSLDGDPTVLVLDSAGGRLKVVSRPTELLSSFPCLPVEVDAQGNLHLADLCAPPAADPGGSPSSPASGVFDLHGNPVVPVPTPLPPAYVKTGEYLSTALDSELYRCQWHRIVLEGWTPPGSAIDVLTYTAEADQTLDTIVTLPDEAWETRQTTGSLDGDTWDCLVRNGGGRYLWLRLRLRGNGAVTPALCSIKVEFPRISLARYLPAVFRAEPVSADFTDRFLSVFDTSFRSVETTLDTEARYFDPLSTPATIDPKVGVDFLTWLAAWIGVALDRQWPESKRRQFVKSAARSYRIRGTREGLWRLLLFYLGMDAESLRCPDDEPKVRCCPPLPNCAPVKPRASTWRSPPLILEHYRLRRWLFVGAGRLGDEAVLWGKRLVNRSELDEGAQANSTQLLTTQDPYRDPFHYNAYQFSVFVPARYGRSPSGRRSLLNLLNAERPAGTRAQLVFVEPRFRVGFQSTIGLDSVVGRYPEGVTLDGSNLGQGTVLSEPPYKRGGPTFEIGRESRIGATTKLE